MCLTNHVMSELPHVSSQNSENLLKTPHLGNPNLIKFTFTCSKIIFDMSFGCVLCKLIIDSFTNFNSVLIILFPCFIINELFSILRNMKTSKRFKFDTKNCRNLLKKAPKTSSILLNSSPFSILNKSDNPECVLDLSVCVEVEHIL